MTTPISIAVKAAKEAGALIKNRLGNPGTVKHKGSVDIVTEMDKSAEELILRIITEQFPDHSILAEEGGAIKGSEGSGHERFRWIIDPIDGTTNFAHGLPFFAVSIGFEANGKVEAGVVYNPVSNELFSAEMGRGALLNDKKISVSQTGTVNDSLVATGFPYDIRTSENNNLDHFKNFTLRAQAVRKTGSAALDLCFTACGRFDGFWELKLKPWDVAAGALILQEAKGSLSDFNSAPFDIYGAECLASNGKIHKEMLDILSIK